MAIGELLCPFAHASFGRYQCRGHTGIDSRNMRRTYNKTADFKVEKLYSTLPHALVPDRIQSARTRVTTTTSEEEEEKAVV